MILDCGSEPLYHFEFSGWSFRLAEQLALSHGREGSLPGLVGIGKQIGCAYKGALVIDAG
jgi:hypothetical protein